MVEAYHNTQNHTNSHISSILYNGHNHLLSILPFFLESGSSEDEQLTDLPFVKSSSFPQNLRIGMTSSSMSGTYIIDLLINGHQHVRPFPSVHAFSMTCQT